jgi:hypothetical protein
MDLVEEDESGTIIIVDFKTPEGPIPSMRFVIYCVIRVGMEVSLAKWPEPGWEMWIWK